MIIKQNADTFLEVNLHNTVSLASLRAELQALKNQLDPIRPTNAELINWAIDNHPFALAKKDRLDRIEILRTRIANYEAL